MELEFNWTLNKVLEAASTAFTDADLTQGPKAITLPHQLSLVKEQGYGGGKSLLQLLEGQGRPKGV